MKLSRIAALAAMLVLGAGIVSCTKQQPTEIKNEARPFTATINVTVKFASAPVVAGTPVTFTITDSEFSRTYKVTRKTDAAGMITLKEGCGSSGLKVIGECQYVIGKGYYGYGSATPSTSNGYVANLEINISE